MKKLFSLLTAVLLCSGMVVQAQLLDAVNAAPERDYLFDGNQSNGQVSGRKNAPQSTWTHHYSWTEDLVTNGYVMKSGSSLSNSAYIVWQVQMAPGADWDLDPALSWAFGIDCYNVGYVTYNSGQNGPMPGTYTVSSTTTWGQIPNKLVCSTSLNKSYYYDGSKMWFTGGSVVVQEGRHGRPYMYSSNLSNSSHTFNITIGDPLALTTTYTSVTVAESAEGNKVVLYANDGNGNNLNLIFSTASIDANVGIPADNYTIGTNVWGSLYDDDGYTDWKLTSGTITISKSGNAISMTTSSLKGKVEDTNYDMNLTISNLTPTKKTITNIPVASASVNKYSGYFNVIGSSSPYDIRLESASVDYRTGYFAPYELEQTNEYTYLKQNSSHISLDYNKQQALITPVNSNIFTEAFVWSTSGSVYRIAAFNGAAYTITYKDKDNADFTGTHSTGYPTTHLYGTNTTLGTATKANHTFDGWFTSSACTGSAVTSLGATAYTGNVTLYAKWTDNTPVGEPLTLTLNQTGKGTVTVRNASHDNALLTFTDNEAQVTQYDDITVTATHATGYSLTTLTIGGQNWKNRQNEDFSTEDEDLTIVAVFSPDVYTITYRDKNNAAFTGTHGANYPTSHTYDTPTNLVNPTKEGYDFCGWYTDDACTVSAGSTLGATDYTANITLYAKWARSGRLTITSNYGAVSGTGYVADPDHVYAGGTEVQLGVTANPGYAFVQWEDGNTDNPRTVYIDGDAAYTAQFIVETAAYASFSFDNPNDDIQIGKITQPDAMCQTEFYPYGISLVGIVAKNTTRTTQNYLQLYIKTNNFRTYNPVNGSSYQGPAYGTYSVVVPSEYGPVVGNCDGAIYESNYYFIYTGSSTDVVIGYKVETMSHSGTCHYQGYEGSLSQRLCIYSSYGANYSNETRSGFATFNNATITVAEGAGGNPYITIRQSGTLLVTVGAPALPYTLAWDANGGNITAAGTAAGSVTEGTSITAPTVTRTGYTFTGWSPDFTGYMPAANTTYVAQWTPKTYTAANNINGNGGNNGQYTATYNATTIAINTAPTRTGYTLEGLYEESGCTHKIADASGNLQASTAYTNSSSQWTNDGNVTLYANWTVNTNTAYTVKHYKQNLALDGYTLEETDNLTGTTATSTAAVAKSYTGFTAQEFSQGTIAANGSTVVNIYYNRNLYTVTWKNGETTLETDENVPYGATPSYDGSEPTKDATAQYTYTFEGWDPALAPVTDDATYSATFSQETQSYTVTFLNYDDTELQSGTLEYGADITYSGETPTKDADADYLYTFAGWDTNADGTADYAAGDDLGTVSGAVTFKAAFNAQPKNLTLQDMENADYYNDFAERYNGVEMNTVTYNRTFRGSIWSTLCLPFDVEDLDAQMDPVLSKVYEFRYAEGDASVGVDLHFYPTTSMNAGQGYLVRTASTMSGPFEFYDVTIDTERDNADYAVLEGDNNGTGVISLVGTLRKYVLDKDALASDAQRYMALKDNKIYYPGVNTTVPAYRAFFKIDSPTPVAPRVRIVVEDEQATPIEVIEMDGEGNLMPVSGEEVRKYIEDGVLIIERNGKRYNAVGAEL